MNSKVSIGLGIFLALPCAVVPVFGPVHEIGHVIVGLLTGARVTGMSWAFTYIDQDMSTVSPLVYIAGYLAEAVALTIVARKAVGKQRWGLLSFALTYQLLLFPLAYMGTDYLSARYNFGEAAAFGWWFLLVLMMVFLLIQSTRKVVDYHLRKIPKKGNHKAQIRWIEREVMAGRISPERLNKAWERVKADNAVR